jgi:hypothetical protein
MSKTRKNIPWSGWKKLRPNFHQRTVMKRKCGKKCFLGSKTDQEHMQKLTFKIQNKIYFQDANTICC